MRCRGQIAMCLLLRPSCSVSEACPEIADSSAEPPASALTAGPVCGSAVLAAVSELHCRGHVAGRYAGRPVVIFHPPASRRRTSAPQKKKPVMEIFAFFLVTELQTTEVRVEIARERQGQWPYKLVCIPT